jgi:DNA-binding CsgD family transcriptional regulator
LITVVDALVRSDLTGVCLGGVEDGIGNVEGLQWRRFTDLPLWSSAVRGREHPAIAPHDPTGLFITGRRSDVGSLRSLWPTVDVSHFDVPVGYENLVGAPIDFYGHSFMASYRAGGDFSDGDVRLMNQLRPVASRLLRRATVSGLAEASASAWGLSPREAEVFAFAGVGLSQPWIASILGLSVGTVRTHLGKAYAKAAVRSRVAATSALLDVVGPTALKDASRWLVPGADGPLTRQEVAVLRLAATGRTTAAIASLIGISTETAKTHLANVYRKLGVANRSQALLFFWTARVSVGRSERTTETDLPPGQAS